jgi:ADP-ribose pyrophosphatase YjhB (NUDIX family)
MNPLVLLPLSTPVVTAWAAWQARRIARHGAPLSAAEREVAESVGVIEPERIRVLLVERIPFPGGGLVDRLALRWGLPGTHVDGLTLGHGIFLRRHAATLRLLAHECRHVQQVEAAGSLMRFLADYLRQVARHGYEQAPFEIDARLAAARWARPDRPDLAAVRSPARD